MRTIITHNGSFHADDVLAVAAIKLFLDEAVEIVRTRKKQEIKTGDFVVDVGGAYDPDENLFDHHQPDGAGVRDNGVPYAAFGLVWQKFGLNLCDGDETVVDIIDRRLVQPIDALDNGEPLYECDPRFSDTYPYSLQQAIGSFRPTWREDQDEMDTTFEKLVSWGQELLAREIKKASDAVAGTKHVEEIYQKTEDKRLIILDKDLPYRPALTDHPEPLFVVYPKEESGRWRLRAIQEDGFKNRKDLPNAWAGLRGQELEKETGVTGAVYCHSKQFMAVAETKKAALELAQKALAS